VISFRIQFFLLEIRIDSYLIKCIEIYELAFKVIQLQKLQNKVEQYICLCYHAFMIGGVIFSTYGDNLKDAFIIPSRSRCPAQIPGQYQPEAEGVSRRLSIGHIMAPAKYYCRKGECQRLVQVLQLQQEKVLQYLLQSIQRMIIVEMHWKTLIYLYIKMKSFEYCCIW
jgi:hypothetical protein